jgi:osmoprotectant transport system permease protein
MDEGELMDFLVAALGWLADPSHWSGPDGIPMRIAEHLLYSLSGVAAAALIAIPTGIALGHTGRGGFFAINVAGVGRALPTFALLVIAFLLLARAAPSLAFGFWPTFLAMVPLALPPILTNTYVGIRGVDRDVVEAARGMGMSELRIVRAVTFPLGLPLILAGLRTATVAVIATATLGALVAGGGLGRYIVDGLALQQYERLFGGAVLVALLAIGTELAFGLLGRLSGHTSAVGGEP